MNKATNVKNQTTVQIDNYEKAKNTVEYLDTLRVSYQDTERDC